MKGTIPRKVGRLLGDFVFHPQFVPRYVNHNVANGCTPLDLELPWFSYSAIDFLDRYLEPGMKVCEYGSGGSTLFFARRVQSVYSIEDNREWFDRVFGVLKEKQIVNVQMTLCPFDVKEPTGFESSSYLHAIPDERFDVIVIDGSEEWVQVRPVCFRHAENYVKPGGIIVVDDSWRYRELHQNNRARKLKVFRSVGPCRPGVTSTDVFFY